MNRKTSVVGALLFASGLCALIYQTVWMRELRLVFGASQTARTIYATLTAVFPHVQTWTTGPGDVVLLASVEPIVFDVDAIRARQAREPFRAAIRRS